MHNHKDRPMDRLTFFDAHCDTILKILDEGADFEYGSDGGLHVTLDGMRTAGMGAQVFACYVLEARNPGRSRERGLQVVAAVHELCRTYADDLAVWEGGPLPLPDSPERMAAIIALEGADPLEGDPEAIADFHRQGVRLVTLAWDDNPFCGTTFGAGGGLTRRGEELVQFCEELGVMVDVSHASDIAFWDVCRVASRPFVASHSNCRAVCGSPRNLTDEMIRALAERGGVMGLNLCSGFLSQSYYNQEAPAREAFWAAVRSGAKSIEEAHEESARATASIPRPPLDVVAAHVKHAINVGGEECIGLGGDLDGIESMPAGIEGVADYPKIAETLLGAGLTERQVERVCWSNFARAMQG
ncbi:MAG: hypothetical protein GX604_07840 [Actinobacteria bacterium]|nr:hypothetical protein [Actinomycetota bacterium]